MPEMEQGVNSVAVIMNGAGVVMNGPRFYISSSDGRHPQGWTAAAVQRRTRMAQEIPLLPANRAFVVQFRAQPEGTPLRWEGRVEHLVSGEVLRFDSQVQLLAFLRRLLTSA